MKKKIILGSIAVSTSVFALGGVNALTTATPSGLGNPVQQAEISPDSVYYNPSALGFLEEGQYFGVGNSFVKPDYKQKGSDGELTIDNLQNLPTAQYVYVKDGRVYYIGVGSMGQGGMLKADTNLTGPRGRGYSGSAKVDYLAPGIVLGMTQKLNDKIAVSLGGRYTYVYQNVEDAGVSGNGELTLKGGGFAPEIGLFYRATPRLDLSTKYLFQTKIEQSSSGNVSEYIDSHPSLGSLPERNDYPAILSSGAAYKINDKNTVYLGHNIIFEDSDNVYGKSEGQEYGNTQEYQLGYKRALSDKFDLNLGYTRVDRGTSNDHVTTFQELDANVYGIALVYKYDENTQYTLALNTNHYDSYNSEDNSAYRRENIVGISMTKKI